MGKSLSSNARALATRGPSSSEAPPLIRVARAFLAVLLVLSFITTAGAAPTDDRVVRLFTDESKILKVDSLKRVSITNPRIADVVVIGPGELRVDGITIGRTTLYVWDKDGRARYEVVVFNRRDDVATAIKEAINLPEVVVTVVNDRVVLKGWVENDAQRRVATEIAKVYTVNGTVVDLMQVHPPSARRGAPVTGSAAAVAAIRSGSLPDPEEEMRRILDLPEVKITVIYDPNSLAQAAQAATLGQAPQPPRIAAVLLEGFVDDQRDAERAQVVAQAYSGQVTNLIEVVRPLQILVQSHLLQVSVVENTNYGFQWGTTQVAGTAGGPFTVASQTPIPSIRFLENPYNAQHGQGTFFGAKVDPTNNLPWEFENLNRLDPLMATVSWLLQNNKARLLANPKIVTRSGKNAEINVGGQIVYPLVGATGTPSTGFLPFGTIMNITPEVDHKGNINTILNITVSNPDASLGTVINGFPVPGTRNRNTRSEVTVKDGEHIVVSGLLQENNGKNYSKTPYLSRIPILGNLFTTKNYSTDKTELVIVVTPNIVLNKEQQELRIAEQQGLKHRKNGKAARKEVATRERVTKAGKVVEIAQANGPGGFGDPGQCYPVPAGGPPEFNPAAGVQPHGADPLHMSEWQANSTAFGYAPGTEPLPPGEAPNPKVPTLPAGDSTARGRMQGLLGGMRDQLNWAHNQREMDHVIPPPKPYYVHGDAATGWKPNRDNFSKRTYDSLTPREALVVEGRVLNGGSATGYVPPVPRRSRSTSVPQRPAPAPRPPPPADAVSPTDAANNSASPLDASVEEPVRKTSKKAKAKLSAEEALSDAETEHYSPADADDDGEDAVPTAAPSKPKAKSSKAKKADSKKSTSKADGDKAANKSDGDSFSQKSDDQMFQDLEAAFDKVKSRASGSKAM